jgi:hypothetical protein
MKPILTTVLVAYLFITPVAFAVDIERPIHWGKTDLRAKNVVWAADTVEVADKGKTSQAASEQSSAIDGIGRVSSVACDGTTDVTTALNADMATYSSQGGGDYYLPPHTQCAVGGSADVQIPGSVRMRCQSRAAGYAPHDSFMTQPCTLILDPTHTIHSPMAPGSPAGIDGVRIIRKGYSSPTTLRQMINEAALYSGTAITCSPVPSPSNLSSGTGGMDFDVSHVLIIGFSYALKNDCDRLRFTESRFDTTNGFLSNNCFDTCVITDIEAWPFGAGNPYVTGPQWQTSNISGAANNGSGLIRLTLSSVPATPLVTGDTAVVGSVDGVPNAAGRWTITVINSTTVDLVGSTFAGTYISGGTLQISAVRRTGTAFDIENAGGGPILTRITDIGHDVQLHYGASSDITTCRDCWLDNNVSNNPDPVPVSVLVDGSASHASFQGGFINSTGVAIKVNSRGDGGLFLNGTIVGALGGQSGVVPIQVMAGALTVTGGMIENAALGQHLFYVSDAAAGLSISGTAIPSGQTMLQGSSDCPKVSVNGNLGPCTGALTFAGSTTAGAPAYSLQGSSFSQNGAYTQVPFSFITTSLGGAAGNMLLAGLPYTAASDLVSPGCYFTTIGGVTLEPGYSWLAGVIIPSTTTVKIVELGSSGTKDAPVSIFGRASSLSGVCTFKRNPPPS